MSSGKSPSSGSLDTREETDGTDVGRFKMNTLTINSGLLRPNSFIEYVSDVSGRTVFFKVKHIKKYIRSCNLCHDMQ